MAPKTQNPSSQKIMPAGKRPAASVPSSPSGAPAAGGAMTPTLQRTEEGAAPMTSKNFRNHPDMENFFRFIYEHDLRFEALGILDEILDQKRARRLLKAKKAIAS